MKQIPALFLTSLLSGVITLGAYKLFIEDNALLPVMSNDITTAAPLRTVANAYEAPDFTQAAEKTIHTVVHVKNVSYRTAPRNPVYEFIYGYQGGQTQAQIGTGSGVIISPDGYIVTNNHVIQGANDLEITLNDNRTFKADLIGTDSKTDIALLKIKTDEKLPFAVFGDSDAINVGEWVLAVGNPYNLNSTVTAGIVSAKARNLSNTGIQSFIQTDAAVNPGNSGGALVNSRGELIGINTMISSMTGSYVGYSFAVPSNMTRKIIQDFMEFGKVQQGILGVQGFELNRQIAQDKQLKLTQGFYVDQVTSNSGAEKAGIKKGDIITQIDNRTINNFLELNAIIATKRPDDVVKVNLQRAGKEMTVEVALSKKEIARLQYNGFEIENLSDQEKAALGIRYGVKIKDIENPQFKAYENELKEAIIIGIDGNEATDIETAQSLLNKSGGQKNIRLDIITRKRERIRLIL